MRQPVVSTDSVAQFVAEARRQLAFDPETGILTSRVDRIHSPAGTIIGYADRDGYLHARFAGRQYLVHRLGWLIVYGRWPVGEIDHRDGVRTNNRIANLREADRGQNCSNRRSTRDLPKGVYREGNGGSARKLRSNARLFASEHTRPLSRHTPPIWRRPSSFAAILRGRRR